jgi:glycosyltransferase involved in cell wall biosynthesis
MPAPKPGDRGGSAPHPLNIQRAVRILFLVRRVGPYHDARFEAAGRLVELTVFETRPESKEYPWTTAASVRHYRLAALGEPENPETGLRGAELDDALERCFKSVRPEAVACTGWADPEYHAALRRCHKEGIPAIVMSDSSYEDEPRSPWRERMKGVLVRAFSAAIVAGTRSRDYLRNLGFPSGAIFEPWDVVDNDYFGGQPDESAFGAASSVPSKPYFLCVSRYLPKKNLFRLVDAYGGYLRSGGAGTWDLVILGSGELERPLNEAVASAGISNRVHRPGFVQYDRLPPFYARAGACILPSISDQWGLAINEAMASGIPVLVSSACGCAPDLVEEGVSGFVFDPLDTAALSGLLRRVAGLPEKERLQIGAAGRERISLYSPRRFADALVEAAGHACRNPAFPGIAARTVLWVLARRF